MNYYFVLDSDFHKMWPQALMAEVRRRDPEARFHGIVVGGAAVRRNLVDVELIDLKDFDCLDSLERQWVADYEGQDLVKLRSYEELLGSEALNRVVIGDRIVGAGFTAGACSPPTRLRKAIERKPGLEFYYLQEMVDLFYRRLDDLRPNFVFAYAMASGAIKALEVVSKHLGVSFRTISMTGINQVMVLGDSSYRFESAIERYLADKEKPKVSPENLEIARRYIKEFRESPVSPGYTKVVHARFRKNLRFSQVIRSGLATVKRLAREARDPELKYMRRPAPIDAFRWHFDCWARARRLERSGVVQPFESLNVGTRFAYFPLHREPEASTMIRSPMTMNQLMMIEALAKSIPPSMKLVVKDHLPMMGMREQSFYERLLRIPKVVLAHPLDNGLEIVKRADLVAVLTGTAGWEAVLLGRRALYLGESWRRHLRGAFSCFDLAEMPEVVSQLLAAPPVLEEEVEKFIASLIEDGFDCPFNFLLGDAADVEADEEAVKAIVERLFA